MMKTFNYSLLFMSVLSTLSLSVAHAQEGVNEKDDKTGEGIRTCDSYSYDEVFGTSKKIICKGDKKHPNSYYTLSLKDKKDSKILLTKASSDELKSIGVKVEPEKKEEKGASDGSAEKQIIFAQYYDRAQRIRIKEANEDKTLNSYRTKLLKLLDTEAKAGNFSADSWRKKAKLIWAPECEKCDYLREEVFAVFYNSPFSSDSAAQLHPEAKNSQQKTKKPKYEYKPNNDESNDQPTANKPGTIGK